MKKLFYCASLFAALMLASCGGKSTPSADADVSNNEADTTVNVDTTATEGDATASVDGEVLPDDANEFASTLDEKLSSGDAKGVSALLEQAKAKVTELAKTDPDKAKEYVSQLQQWVKKNSTTLKEAAKKAGNDALSSSVATAISSVTSLNAKDIVNSLANTASSNAEDLGNAALNTAKEAVMNKVSESKVGKAVETAKKAKETYDNLPETTKKAAKEKASEAVNKGAEKANEAVQKGLKSLGL